MFIRKTFFDEVRPIFGGTLTPDQVRGMNELLDEGDRLGLVIPFIAYALATAWWETGRTMIPVREYGRGKNRKYGKPGRNGGQIPYGRGLVQITWDENYERADRELGLKGKLIRDYDLALDTSIAVRILYEGMTEGWFAGDKSGRHTFARHLSGAQPDYEEARRIINGTDHCHDIAAAARRFERALRASLAPADAPANVPAPAPAPLPVSLPPSPQAPAPVPPAAGPGLSLWHAAAIVIVVIIVAIVIATKG